MSEPRHTDEPIRPGPEEASAEASGRDADRPGSRDFDVFRLRLGNVVAFLAAIALLFIMAGDWYSTLEGVEAREIESRAGQELPGSGLIDQGSVEDARVQAQKAERNAWQASSPLDVLVLIALLVTVLLAIAAAALRAAGRSFEPRRSPSALAGGAAIVAFLLVILQAVARLDLDTSAVFQVGLPLGAIALGAIAVGSAMAVRAAIEEDEEQGGTASVRPSEAAAGAEGAPRSGTYNRAS